MASISANGANGHHQFVLTVTDTTAAGTFNDSVTHSLSYTFQLKPIQTGWDWSTSKTISWKITIGVNSFEGTIPSYDGSSKVTLKSGTTTYVQTTSGTPSIGLSIGVTDNAGYSYTCGNASNSGTMPLSTQTKAVYTNTIEHWAYGWKNGEGNNTAKDSFKLDEDTFTCQYGSTFTLSASRGTTVPNGFYLVNVGTSAVTGSWQIYSLGSTITQQAKAMGFQYFYHPYTYTITYNLEGGSFDSTPPTTYDVLYEVLFPTPKRAGYTFEGWYIDGWDLPVSGVNVGATGSFASVSELYSQLATRTTGNVTVTARWKINTYTISYNANGGTGAPSNDTKTYGVNLTLSTQIPTRNGYEFLGWATTSTATEAVYAAGGIYTANAEAMLYAVWKQLGMLHIKQDGAWKKGQVWFKDGGTWKRGIPWIKVNGVWKKGGA